MRAPKNAYHALIRLGYGVEFEVPSEVAAGLAYLASLGDDPKLGRAAALPPLTTTGAAYLRELGHAARICAPLAGDGFEALYTVGIAAGYLLIQAPEFAPVDVPTSVPATTWDPATETDEHNVKIAYSCRAHAEAFDDPTYEWVVRAYLQVAT